MLTSVLPYMSTGITGSKLIFGGAALVVEVVVVFGKICDMRPTCFADDYEQLVPDDAGQVYDADNQCSTTFGKGSYFCRGRQKLTVGFNGMCTKMYCSTTPAEDNTCTAIIPLEYTSCGDRKWCVRGQCVNDARAPAKVQDTCAQGDDPTYSCNVASCRTSLGRNVYCCQSCLQPLAPHARPPTPPRLPTTSRQTQSPTTQRRQQTTTRQRPATPEITTTPSPPETAPTTQRVPLVCRYSQSLCYICFRAKNRYYFCRQ
ncbi:A disintegrin and metalloproteinase with thrombospondin motifs 19-like [Littorina saxatilis]|uniref:A disintegrin and metalloproteinase with thrombospondin motifs 19-like n=1 Tax=Littorina saxatilis TaxID=31220 RepID=UPI0038B664C3